jgi:hypothetical protein
MLLPKQPTIQPQKPTSQQELPGDNQKSPDSTPDDFGLVFKDVDFTKEIPAFDKDYDGDFQKANNKYGHGYEWYNEHLALYFPRVKFRYDKGRLSNLRYEDTGEPLEYVFASRTNDSNSINMVKRNKRETFTKIVYKNISVKQITKDPDDGFIVNYNVIVNFSDVYDTVIVPPQPNLKIVSYIPFIYLPGGWVDTYPPFNNSEDVTHKVTLTITKDGCNYEGLPAGSDSKFLVDGNLNSRFYGLDYIFLTTEDIKNRGNSAWDTPDNSLLRYEYYSAHKSEGAGENSSQDRVFRFDSQSIIYVFDNYKESFMKNECCEELKALLKKIIKMLEELDPSPSTPDGWRLRPEYHRPQVVYQFVEINENGKTIGGPKYRITVPHHSGSKPGKLPTYKRGNWEIIYVLRDNSKITIHSIDEDTGMNLLNVIKQRIDPDYLKSSYLSKSSPVKTNNPIKEITVKCRMAKYWKEGTKNDLPDWVVKW